MLKDAFRLYLRSGVPSSTARGMAIADASHEASKMVASGISPFNALRYIGLRNPEPVISRLQALGVPWPVTAIDPRAFNLVLGGENENIEDIPTESCLDAHLPKDREPTDEEIERAWEACSQSGES
jgi:hypothetical protein